MGGPGGTTFGAAAPPDAPWLIVVGSTMVDLISYVPRLPEAGETMWADDFALGFGGKGANQAVAIALHGLRTSMIACVGADHFGVETVANLHAHGVDVECVHTVHGAMSGTASIFVEPSGENRIALGAGANQALDATTVSRAFDVFAAGSGEPPRVVVGQLEVPQAAIASAFQRAHEMGATTVLNPGPAAPLHAAVAEDCDWLIPNESELATLLGRDPDHPADDDVAHAASLGADLGVDLVVTLGARGAVVICRGADAIHIAAPAVTSIDSTGAGDAFVGAFAAHLACGSAPVRAAERAVAYASDTVTRRGTQSSYRAADIRS